MQAGSGAGVPAGTGRDRADPAWPADLVADQVVVCDGAMGTMLHSAGAPLDRAVSELNLTAPRLVHDLHVAYMSAGARIIQTNTFDANRLRLTRFGIEDRSTEINIAGARLAREAAAEADPPVLVAGSIGPATVATVVPRIPRQARAATIREQVEALADWVDLILLETFGDIESLAQAAEIVLDQCDLPVLAQMTFGDDGRTLAGEKPTEVAATLAGLPVTAIGANCSVGPSALHDVVTELAAGCRLPISVQPNAGAPMRLGRQLRYAHNVDYFAQAAARFVAEGATIVGGCCGTTPAHIRAIAHAVAELRPARPLRLRRPVGPEPAAPGPSERSDGGAELASGRYRLADQAAEGRWARSAGRGHPARPPVAWPYPGFRVIAGLRAPQGQDVGEFIAAASQLTAAGASLLAVTDPAPPAATVNPVAAGMVLHERTGADLILSFETADRSLSALQADLLGAHALGLRTIVCRTGTSRVIGDYPAPAAQWEAGSQWDVDSVRLIAALAGLNDGMDWRGVAIPHPTQFVIGGSLNTSAADLDGELDRAAEKQRAGAHFLLTDVVYDTAQAGRALSALRVRGIRLPVLATLVPYADPAMVDRLTHELPQVSARPFRLRDLSSPPTIEEASAAALGTLRTLRSHLAGAVVQCPALPDSRIAELIRSLAEWASGDG
jgi:homocysteine S-methyltransferase